MKVQILQVLLKIEVWSWQLLKQRTREKVVICASTGNTSLCISLRAGLKAIVVIQRVRLHSVNYRKSLCMVFEIVSIEGNFDEALEIVKEIVKMMKKLS